MYSSQNLAEKIEKLAKEKGVPISLVLQELGMNKNALFTMKKSGYLPRVESLCKFAEYFQCSLDYLVYGKEKNTTPNELTQNETEQAISETSKELLEVFESLPMRERIKLLNAVYDFQEQYSKNGTADISYLTESHMLSNPLVSQNEKKLFEVFHNFTEMEQVKIIERIEEWLAVKQKRETASRQQALQITMQKPPQAETEPVQPRQWRMAACSADGSYVSRVLTPEEVEIVKSLEDVPKSQY